jgi:hypothetical protein
MTELYKSISVIFMIFEESWIAHESRNMIVKNKA